MSRTNLVKKYILEIPDWVLGGTFLVLLFWLIVFSIEFSQIAVGGDLYHPDWNFFIRPLYASGLFFVEWLLPEMNISLPDVHTWLTGQVKVLIFSLMAMSPVYFVIGALFATKKKVFGIALFILNLMVGCLLTTWLVILTD